MSSRTLCFLCLMMMIRYVSAQIIEIKTIPVASGNQDNFLPSFRSGMAHLFISLDDALNDPFRNPALGAGLSGYRLLISPAIYSSGIDNYGARTIPITFSGRSGRWFGFASVAIQDMKLEGRTGVTNIQPAIVDLPVYPPREFLKHIKNHYISGAIGYILDPGSAELGLSVSRADLNGVSGVNMLYSRSDAVEQSGSATGIRAGLNHSFGMDRSVEGIILFERSEMRHQVFYTEWFYDEILGYSLPYQRIDENLDHTNTWGLQLVYKQPLAATEWDIGGLLTINRKDHPKIPNYELMNIPRDPGASWAYNVGFGISRSEDGSEFGIEFIYEPIWSHTWALASEPVQSFGGGIIQAGEHTVDNTFDFSNYIIRLGISRLRKPVGFQMGLEIHTYEYSLRQLDYIQSRGRVQNENWTEWMLTWGILIDAEDFQINYSGQWQTGVGIPGVETGFMRMNTAALDFLVAPAGALTLQEEAVISHQIILSIPLTD